MVKLSIPQTYSISHPKPDVAVVRSPDRELCLWLARYRFDQAGDQVGQSEADFLDRLLAEVGEELFEWQRLEIEPMERTLNGMPMLQVAIAARSNSVGGKVQGGLFMINTSDYVLVMVVVVQADGFGRKRSELSQIFASIKPD
ncbi:MAG: hypothetical protein SFT94_07395 [Pseudanabaenaceae cyanobacterium bins.68]|nr:hypothetical protein [Pseudanabaenaceae cyanobacterium bins.68]